MKRILAAVVLLFSLAGWSQYGNEWIDYSQKYYSFKIWKDGIYRLDYNLLNAAGVPVSTLDPDLIEVYGFEQEQYIWIEGGTECAFRSERFPHRPRRGGNREDR